MRGLLLAIVLCGVLAGQEAGRLQGRKAELRVDMPGDETGVEVRVGESPAVDEAQMAERLTRYGKALRRGQTAEVTLVKRKGRHIEVHLNGGGFTDRDLMGLPGYDSPHWGMTEEERRARGRMIGVRNMDRRRWLERDYDRLRRKRIRPLRDALERERRAAGGSRFNLRFARDKDAERATEEELTELLRPYLELR